MTEHARPDPGDTATVTQAAREYAHCWLAWTTGHATGPQLRHAHEKLLVAVEPGLIATLNSDTWEP